MAERTLDFWTGITNHEQVRALAESAAAAIEPYCAATYGGTNDCLNGVRLYADWDDDMDSTAGLRINDLFDSIARVAELLGIAYDDEQDPTTDEDNPETAEALHRLADDMEHLTAEDLGATFDPDDLE